MTEGEQSAIADPEPASSRGRPRQGRPVARHLPRDEEILKIAAEVFFHNGYSGTKLEDIAREAGIAKGSLYHYFESKQEIYERLIKDIIEVFDTEEVVAGELGPIQRLALYTRRRARTIAEHPIEVGIIGRQLVQMDDDIGKWARDYRRRNIQYVSEIIVAGQGQGLFRRGDAETLAVFILASITALSEWVGHSLSPLERVEEMVDFILSSVGVTVDVLHAGSLEPHGSAE